VGLAGVILQMKALRLGRIDAFPFLDPPPKRAVDEGYRVLEELGAIDDDGELTPSASSSRACRSTRASAA
jgi:ATP-dependent helicase HrpA